MMLRNVAFVLFIASLSLQDNTAPVIKIVQPASTTAKWNQSIRYTISVSDKEDGESKYDEIPANEVLLEVRPVADDSSTKQGSNIEGLQAMMKSNCMNCHAFESKLIGPSFNAIAAKYEKSAEGDLAKHVRDGSVGIWGDIPMPTHHELSEGELKLMVRWIMDRKVDNSTKYYLGTDGAFRIAKLPAVDAVQVTASYLDKGGLNGEARMVLKMED